MEYPAEAFGRWKLCMQEKELVEDFDKNDNNVIQYVYDQYADDLLSYGKKMGYQKEVLEDAIHDVFYKLCRSPRLLKQITELKFYLFRALKNRLLNIDKSVEKHVTVNEFDISIKTDSLHLLIEAEEQVIVKEKLNRLLQVLSDKQREIIYLRFIHEMTYDEISVLLKMTPASVKNAVYKAIKKVRK